MNDQKNPPTVLTFLIIGIVVTVVFICLNIFNYNKHLKEAEAERQLKIERQQQIVAEAEAANQNDTYIPEEYAMEDTTSDLGTVNVTYSKVKKANGDGDYVEEVTLPNGEVVQGPFEREFSYYRGSEELFYTSAGESGDPMEFSDAADLGRYYIEKPDEEKAFVYSVDEFVDDVVPYEENRVSDELFTLSYKANIIPKEDALAMMAGADGATGEAEADESAQVSEDASETDESYSDWFTEDETSETGTVEDGTIVLGEAASDETTEEKGNFLSKLATASRDRASRLSAKHYILMLAYFILLYVCNWKLFVKAGVEGWKSLIPLYNIYKKFEIVWGKGLACLLLLVPGLNIVISILFNFRMARAYGKKDVFGFLLWFVPVVALPMMAFGSDPYVGPNGVAGGTN